MRSRSWTVYILLSCLLISLKANSEGIFPSQNPADFQTYDARGVIEDILPAEKTITIRHDAISNFMPAMTMPFKVKGQMDLKGLKAGDNVSFQLHVTKTESWVDQIKTNGITSPITAVRTSAGPGLPATIATEHPLLGYKFTNELEQAVSLNDFRGQALAITFFYTRCPLPEYCPRLSKNFQAAQQLLEAMTNAPANWHLISVTFDPEFDSPERLRYYAQSYQYDPKHWTFLTGPPDKIAELAHSSGVRYEPNSGTIDHNFRTLIIDAAGHLQMIFPTTGDLSDQIAAEILKAAAVTNTPPGRDQK